MVHTGKLDRLDTMNDIELTTTKLVFSRLSFLFHTFISCLFIVRVFIHFFCFCIAFLCTEFFFFCSRSTMLKPSVHMLPGIG